ncbi:uncharacterized protein LOC105443272 [Strongylocentrotus purpuratus]|uniref:Uncharacterized protein n=1 Tax=Strongylocentrotus purpuratus TaxID=7668 RepID=A0A7M7PFH4_STRPU|nr:uncharacterized protein LOC105443272 [Strongylocentrotus purpuratus]
MAPITQRVYTTYLMLAMLCVLATYQGASGDTTDVEEARPRPPPNPDPCTPYAQPCDGRRGMENCCGMPSLRCRKYSGEWCGDNSLPNSSPCICRHSELSGE